MVKPQHKWQAAEYHLNSYPQKEAAIHLLEKIQIKGDEYILDLGCGDGKISAILAELAPRGSIIGIDQSENMIRFARKQYKKKYQNLSFFVLDALKLAYITKFDIVFSSFALQWIEDKKKIFKRIYNSLKASGQLVLIVPLDISEALEKAISEIVLKQEWTGYFNNFICPKQDLI